MFADCPQDYDLGLGRWIYMVLRQHGSAWCLSGLLKRLAYSRIDLSLLQRQSTSQEQHGGSEPPAALLFHYMRHSTIDLSLLHLKRASETQNHLTFSYWVPEHQGTGCFMRSECIKLVLVSFTLISHVISCMLHLYCQSYIMFARGTCAS